MSAADDIAMREFSISTATSARKSSKGKWIAVSIIVALVLAGAIVGILFGAKVIGSSSSSNNDPSAGNGDLGNTDSSSSSSSADQIGGGTGSSTGAGSSSTGTISSTAVSSTGTTASSTASTSSSTSTTASSTASISSSTAFTSSSTAVSSSTAASSTGSSSSTGSYLPPQPSKLTYGTYYNPFAVDSPWNSRPLDPVFDTYIIPPDAYYPVVAGGKFSTQIFYARSTDPPNTIHGIPGTDGLANPDIGGYGNVVIPHWPPGTVAASGSDGHCDILDETTGILHSFWKLVNDQTLGYWTASLYSWCHINGTGWGDPAHYYQGPRATGIASGAGIIRSHEVNDGLPYFPHALTMSLTFSGFSPNPAYIFPGTASDIDAATTNYGPIPEGALMMLPPSFNTSLITGAPLRKVAETLKRYGAYASDRNTGTPYALFVENGGKGFPLSNVTGLDGTVASELQMIRIGMRRVINATTWVDGYDRPRAPLVPGRPNLLSMRGPWFKQSGPGIGDFDTWKQALVFPYANSTRTQVAATNGYGLKSLAWIGPKTNQTYNFTVHAQGGALLNMQMILGTKVFTESGLLGDGGTWSVKWPNGGYPFFIAQSGINVSSQVWGELRPVEELTYDMSLGKFVPPPQPSPATATPYPDPVGLPKLNFGTYLTPFSVDSPWNSRPLNPVLEAPLIPIDMYIPAVSSGSFSTQIFYATASDPSVTVIPRSSSGILNPDFGGYSSSIVIPHWPAAAQNASGGTGYADIYDETTGIIHSFWQLKHNTTSDVWAASLYTWCHANGTGWGDPAHYDQGPRATGVSSGAGLIRNHEVDDGLPFFRHALTMSLTWSGLSGSPESGAPGYVFPATSSDTDVSRNYGHIPQGSLLMLPPSFNVSALSGAPLRKIAETLKRYGAYVTDRNDGAPFAIYVENGGSGFKLNTESTADLQTIRASLSRVLSASQWIDGSGNVRAAPSPGNPNLLSMRGTWAKYLGPGTGSFETIKQAVVFPLSNTTSTKLISTNGLGIASVSWARIATNASMIYTVHATGGATLELQLLQNGKQVNTSTALGNGQSWNFIWPEGAKFWLLANSGINQSSSVWAELRYTSVQPFSFSTGSYYPYP